MLSYTLLPGERVIMYLSLRPGPAVHASLTQVVPTSGNVKSSTGLGSERKNIYHIYRDLFLKRNKVLY